MSQPEKLTLVLIAVIAVLFPADFLVGVELAFVWIKTRALNLYLMLQAWRMHRLICADMAKMGLPKPAFGFVPIWKRQWPKRNP